MAIRRRADSVPHSRYAVGCGYERRDSEHSPLTVAGCRSLAVINFTPDGVLPNWHRPSDTVANIDVSVLDRTEQFVWELLHHLDRQA